MNKSNKKSQALKIFKLSNLSKKLLALLTISVLSIIVGACTSKKPDNQNPAPTPAPAPKIQLDVSGIDKDKAFFVTPTGTKEKDCTTWENACDLQTAIDKANADANKKFVLVAQGTYFADPEKKDKTKTFILKNGVKIYGGFDVSVEELKRSAQASTLEGKLSDTLKTKLILKGENLLSETVLDGFVIQNAKSEDTSARSAGLSLTNSNPKLTNLVFKNNNASTYGGAIFNNASSSPSISNSTFIGNSAGKNGGVIYNNSSSPSISNSILWNNKVKNTAQDAGNIENIYNYNATSKPIIKNSILNANSAVTMQSGQSDFSKTDPYNFMDFDKTEFKDNQTPANFVIESDGKITDTDSQTLIKDKGDNALYKATTGKEASNDKDLAGKPRLNGASIDIGAYELQD